MGPPHYMVFTFILLFTEDLSQVPNSGSILSSLSCSAYIQTSTVFNLNIKFMVSPLDDNKKTYVDKNGATRPHSAG